MPQISNQGISCLIMIAKLTNDSTIKNHCNVHIQGTRKHHEVGMEHCQLYYVNMQCDCHSTADKCLNFIHFVLSFPISATSVVTMNWNFCQTHFLVHSYSILFFMGQLQWLTKIDMQNSATWPNLSKTSNLLLVYLYIRKRMKQKKLNKAN